MEQYLQNMARIAAVGYAHPDRTKVGRISVFGKLTECYSHADGLPYITTRFVPFGGVKKELLWWLKGHNNIREDDAPVAFWDSWAVTEATTNRGAEKIADGLIKGQENPDIGLTKELLTKAVAEDLSPMVGSIGPMYGWVWRNAPIPVGAPDATARPMRTLEELPSDRLDSWEKMYEELTFMAQKAYPGGFVAYANHEYYKSFDQINELILGLKKNPYSSRHLLTSMVPGYNPPDNLSPDDAALLGFGCLMPCHPMVQFFVRDSDGVRYLDAMMFQRSADYPLGRPYNIASYSLLQAMIAQCVDMVPGEISFPVGDAHIYTNQLELVREQLMRTPYPRPKLWLNPEIKDIFKFTLDDIKLMDYQHYPKIDYPRAV